MTGLTFRVLEAATHGRTGRYRTVWRVVRSDGRTYCEAYDRDRAREIALALSARYEEKPISRRKVGESSG